MQGTKEKPDVPVEQDPDRDPKEKVPVVPPTDEDSTTNPDMELPGKPGSPKVVDQMAHADESDTGSESADPVVGFDDAATVGKARGEEDPRV